MQLILKISFRKYDSALFLVYILQIVISSSMKKMCT